MHKFSREVFQTTLFLQTGWVNIMRKIRKILITVLIVLVAYLIYLVTGGLAPFLKQPKVTTETEEEISAIKFYSDETGPDRAVIIEDNEEALKLRLKMISDAKKRLVLSTFDFRTDEAGMDVLSALLDAAERGVKVEIFADGFNSCIQMERNPYFYALSSHKNVKIIIYNKINLLTPWKGLGRMHDKYVIMDDKAYVLGGRNTFGYFLGDYGGHKNYDRDVLVYNTGSKDSSIYQIQDYYEQITSMECCSVFHDKESLGKKKKVKEAAKELRDRYVSLQKKYKGFLDIPYNYAENTFETNTINLLSNPTTVYAKEPKVFYALMQLAKEAENEVKIHTPYIICDKYMYEQFSKIASKSVIMLNSAANNGNPFGSIDYINHKKDIINTGIGIKEYEGGVSYHGKSMTVDDDIAIVGSFNMDMRSTYIDTELMLVINSKAVNAQLKENMEKYEEQAATVKDEKEYSEIPKGMTMKPLSKKQKKMKFLLGRVMDLIRFIL